MPISVNAMKLKCRIRRFVTAERPPPGGPMTPQKAISTMVRTSNVFRSYHPWWSIHWRMISRGGCAPYSSFAGMFRSSTTNSIFLPVGGPKMPFRRLSMTASIVSCVMFAPVDAEKAMLLGMYLSGMFFPTFSLMTTDLPVPVAPQHRIFQSFSRRIPTRYDDRTVSIVGTAMSAKGVPGTRTYFSSVSNHPIHFCSLRWNCMS
mmetsp:Transcript_48481/g.115356  ORF Transcript_48481/g.115356 Transcript_48481/m.115356 type:complete len:204 (-) Transcript_48481:575-1186(-)